MLLVFRANKNNITVLLYLKRHLKIIDTDDGKETMNLNSWLIKVMIQKDVGIMLLIKGLFKKYQKEEQLVMLILKIMYAVEHTFGWLDLDGPFYN